MQSDDEIEYANEYLLHLRSKYHERQMILKCLGPGGLNCERMFSPVLTDSGICYSFMAESLDNIYNSNHYIEYFKDIFLQEQNIEEYPNQNLSSDFKLFMVLDSHQSGI